MFCCTAAAAIFLILKVEQRGPGRTGVVRLDERERRIVVAATLERKRVPDSIRGRDSKASRATRDMSEYSSVEFWAISTSLALVDDESKKTGTVCCGRGDVTSEKFGEEWVVVQE
jgi:hypothetical protein